MRIHILKMALFCALLALLATSYSCTIEETAPIPADVPVDTGPADPMLNLVADGLTVDGASLHLGAHLTSATELLGVPAQVRVMGPAGTVYSYPSLGLELWSRDDSTINSIHVLLGYTGSADDGVVPGADDSVLMKSVGIGAADPFGMGRHYPDRGLFVGVLNETVILVTRSVVQ